VLVGLILRGLGVLVGDPGFWRTFVDVGVGVVVKTGRVGSSTATVSSDPEQADKPNIATTPRAIIKIAVRLAFTAPCVQFAHEYLNKNTSN
jgi:hypothetical protein